MEVRQRCLYTIRNKANGSIRKACINIRWENPEEAALPTKSEGCLFFQPQSVDIIQDALSDTISPPVSTVKD